MKMTILIITLFLSIFLVGCITSKATPDDKLFCDTENDCDNDGDHIKISLTDVSTTMRKHSIEYEGTTLNFLVMKGSDKEVRTAFDACDVCGGYKGYYQNGEDVVCKNCGKHFRIDDIGTKNGPGGCWPSFLGHKIVDGNVIINRDELIANSYRFA